MCTEAQVRYTMSSLKVAAASSGSSRSRQTAESGFFAKTPDVRAEGPSWSWRCTAARKKNTTLSYGRLLGISSKVGRTEYVNRYKYKRGALPVVIGRRWVF